MLSVLRTVSGVRGHRGNYRGIPLGWDSTDIVPQMFRVYSASFPAERCAFFEIVFRLFACRPSLEWRASPKKQNGRCFLI